MNFLLPITQHPIGWPHPPPLLTREGGAIWPRAHWQSSNSINSTSEYRRISIQMAYTTEDGAASFEFGSTTWNTQKNRSQTMWKEVKTGTSYLIVQFIERNPFDNNINGSKYGTYPKKKEINNCKRKIKVKCSPGSQSSSGSANKCPLNLCLKFCQCPLFSPIPSNCLCHLPTLQNISYHQQELLTS